RGGGPGARVGGVVTGQLPTLGTRHCLDEAFRLLQEKSAPAVGIVDAAQRLIGLVTSATVGEMLMVHRAMPRGFRFGPWSGPPSRSWSRPAAASAPPWPTQPQFPHRPQTSTPPL